MASIGTVESSSVSSVVERGAALLAAHDDMWADLSSETARALASAGVESFASRGFHGTSLRDITARSGLSTAALYVHFRSKEELLFEISRRGYAVAASIVDGAVGIDDPAEALQVLVYAMVRWQAEQHLTARVVFFEQEALSAEHAAALRELRRSAERGLRALIERGIARGAFGGGPVRGISAALLSLAVDVARWYGTDARFSPDELARHYSGFALRMVGA